MPDHPENLPPPLTDPTGSPYVTFRSAPGPTGQVIDYDHHQRVALVHWGTYDGGRVDRNHLWSELTPVDYLPPGMVLIPVTDPDEKNDALARLAEIEAADVAAKVFPDVTHDATDDARQPTTVEEMLAESNEARIAAEPETLIMAHEKGADPGDPCPECDGSGVGGMEHHGPGLDEPIGCQNCAGTGTVHKPSCPIWRGDFACTCLADGA